MVFVLSNVIADPFAIGMLSIASVAWLITFIAAIAANVESTFPRFSWWGIMFQLVTNSSIAILYLTDTLEFYRNLLLGMVSICFVYSTNSTNSLVYSTNSAKAAGAAGCILLSMINAIWLLYFGGDPASPTSQWIDSFSHGQRTHAQSASRLQQHNPQASQKMMTENSVSATNNPFNYSSTQQQQPYMASSTQLNGLENGEEPSGQGYYSNTATAINASNDLSDNDIDEEIDDVDADQEDSYPYTVRALYDYDANPADATELSFKKNEILRVQSIDGRWWQAKNSVGKVGILPSNYVEKIDN